MTAHLIEPLRSNGAVVDRGDQGPKIGPGRRAHCIEGSEGKSEDALAIDYRPEQSRLSRASVDVDAGASTSINASTFR